MNNILPPLYPTDAYHALPRDTAYELNQNLKAHPALIAQAINTVMAICCQGLAVVELPGRSACTSPLSLYFLTLATSGDGKSPVDEHVRRAITAFDRHQIELHRKAVADHTADLEVWDADKKRLQSKLKRSDGSEAVRLELTEHLKRRPVSPRPWRLIYQEVSERALREALDGDGQAIALAADEGDVVLESDLICKRGLLNALWTGAADIPLDRAGCDFLDIRNPKLTVGLMVQPDIFAAFLRGRGALGRASGQWARYLIAQPPSTKGWRYMGYEDQQWSHLPVFHARCAALLSEYADRKAKGTPPEVLRFSREAKEAWVTVNNRLEPQMAPGGVLHNMSDFASKAMEMAGRLAAIFHLFSGQEGSISVDTFNRAVRVIDYHMQEYSRLFDAAGMSQELVDAEAIARHLYRSYWLTGRYSVARNEAYRHGPVRRSTDRFGRALDVLAARGAFWMGRLPTGRLMLNLNSGFFSQMALS